MKDEGDVLSSHEVPRELEQMREGALGEPLPHVPGESTQNAKYASGRTCETMKPVVPQIC